VVTMMIDKYDNIKRSNEKTNRPAKKEKRMRFGSSKNGRISAFSCLIYMTVGIFIFTSFGLCAQESSEKESAATVIERVLEEIGIEGAKAKFFLIKTQKESYVFREEEFRALGERFLKSGRPHVAVTIFEMAVEIFPHSANAHNLLAASFYAAVDNENSLNNLIKMRSIRDAAFLAEYVKNNQDIIAHTAEEVIERHTEAIGGRKAWQKVKTMVVIFSIQSSGGEQTRISRMYKRPLFYRQGVEGSNRFRATDGESVWTVSGTTWKKNEENPEPYLRMISMDNWFMDYAAKGISYTFIGLEYFNGSPVYHLRRTFWDGFQQDLYFSAVSNLLTEIKSDYVQIQPFMKSYLSLWNYREVDGIKIPFVFIRSVGSMEPPHGGLVEEVKINVPLNDSLFIPPKDRK
jgi:hypothetical protein